MHHRKEKYFMATTPTSFANANGIGGTTSTAGDAQNRVPKQELGKNEFLQILSVQMSNQDPLEPTSDTEWIAQMAQFSSLEQMQEMNSAVSSQKAYSMIGKFVAATVNDGTGSRQEISGIVSGVTRSGGVDYLMVGNFKVPMTSISYVIDSGIDQQALIAQTSNLIGKTITAEVATSKLDEFGNFITEKITGEVEYITIENGTMFAKLKDTATMKDKKVMISDIIKYGNETAPVEKPPVDNNGGTGDKGETGSTEKK